MHEWIRTTETGTPRVVQKWQFNATYFVAPDERLNLDLASVRQIETQDIASFSYSTTLN